MSISAFLLEAKFSKIKEPKIEIKIEIELELEIEIEIQ
jgi:hypothetical protein